MIKKNQIIKEYATSFLDEDKLIAFLSFYNFLNNNKLGIRKTGRKINGSWAITYKNKSIGRFNLDSSWSINYFYLFFRNECSDKFEKYLSHELKDFILSNINTKAVCCVKGTCHSKENMTILGKTFNNRVCVCYPVILIDPNGKMLEYAKELVLIGKNIIAEVAAN